MALRNCSPAIFTSLQVPGVIISSRPHFLAYVPWSGYVPLIQQVLGQSTTSTRKHRAVVLLRATLRHGPRQHVGQLSVCLCQTCDPQHLSIAKSNCKVEWVRPLSGRKNGCILEIAGPGLGRERILRRWVT